MINLVIGSTLVPAKVDRENEEPYILLIYWKTIDGERKQELFGLDRNKKCTNYPYWERQLKIEDAIRLRDLLNNLINQKDLLDDCEKYNCYS